MQKQTRRNVKKITKLNQADSIFSLLKISLKELGDKLPADKKAPIEAALQKTERCS